MKTIPIPNGILHMQESKAVCPHCERKIPIEEIADKYYKNDNHLMKMKCKCKRMIYITEDFRGDFLACTTKAG